MIVEINQPAKVEGLLFAWDGNPWRPKFCRSCETRCDAPPGEPTGENKIPPIPEKGFEKGMLALKIEKCNAIKNGEPTEELENTMSGLRIEWKKLDDKRKADLLKQFLPGSIVGNTVKGLVYPLLVGVVVVGAVAAGVMYASNKTKTTETLERLGTRRLI